MAGVIKHIYMYEIIDKLRNKLVYSGYYLSEAIESYLGYHDSVDGEWDASIKKYRDGEVEELNYFQLVLEQKGELGSSSFYKMMINVTYGSLTYGLLNISEKIFSRVIKFMDIELNDVYEDVLSCVEAYGIGEVLKKEFIFERVDGWLEISERWSE